MNWSIGAPGLSSDEYASGEGAVHGKAYGLTDGPEAGSMNAFHDDYLARRRAEDQQKREGSGW